MRPSLHLISLGCTKNLVDSEVMLGRLRFCPLTSAVEEADIIIINTCGFIQAAKQESIAEILAAAQGRKEGAILVVSGCLSERYAKELEAEIAEIDLIIGVRDYDRIDSLLEPMLAERGFHIPRFHPASPAHTAPALKPSPHKPSKPARESPQSPKPQASLTPESRPESKVDSRINPLPAKAQNTPQSKIPSSPQGKIQASKAKVFLASEQHERVITGSRLHAYIKLSEGCNQHCAFCAIPSFKGRLQSRSIESITQEVAKLAGEGFLDFSFIAQDSSSYLRDRGIDQGLVRLIDALDSQALAKNARIHYLYPASTSVGLIHRIIASPIVQNYFDMPLQHASENVLKRMRRGHSKHEMLELLEQMRKAPNAFIRSSFIVGFPGESEEEFAELCDLVAQGIFDRANLFAFSQEEGTAAYRLEGQIPARVTNARLNRLNHLLRDREEQRAHALLGRRIEAFIEATSQRSTYLYSARDRRWGLEIDGEILINDFLPSSFSPGLYEVSITDVQEDIILGSALRKLP